MTSTVALRVFERRSRYRVEWFDDITPSVAPYLVKGMLPRLGLAFYAGQSKAGKTFIALDHTLKIACGAKVMGRPAKQVGVVYVAAEDPDGCRLRVEAWRKRYPRESLTPFALIGQRVDLNDTDSVDDLKGAIRDAAAEFEAQGFSLGVIVFDTLARCIPGMDENSGADMGRAIATVESFGDDFKALAVVVAHHGKTPGGGIRGWSGMGAAADAVITVERDPETLQRTLILDKVKNGPDGDRIAFTLEARPIGVNDEDGEEMWSCTVNYEGPADVVARPKRAVLLTPAEETMLVAVGWVIDNGASQPPPVTAIGVRDGTRAVKRADVVARAEVLGLRVDGETDAAWRQRYGRALTALQTKRRIRMEGNAIWPVG